MLQPKVVEAVDRPESQRCARRHPGRGREGPCRVGQGQGQGADSRRGRPLPRSTSWGVLETLLAVPGLPGGAGRTEPPPRDADRRQAAAIHAGDLRARLRRSAGDDSPAVKKVQTLLGEIHDCDVWVATWTRSWKRSGGGWSLFGSSRPFDRVRSAWSTCSAIAARRPRPSSSELADILAGVEAGRGNLAANWSRPCAAGCEPRRSADPRLRRQRRTCRPHRRQRRRGRSRPERRRVAAFSPRPCGRNAAGENRSRPTGREAGRKQQQVRDRGGASCFCYCRDGCLARTAHRQRPWSDVEGNEQRVMAPDDATRAGHRGQDGGGHRRRLQRHPHGDRRGPARRPDRGARAAPAGGPAGAGHVPPRPAWAARACGRPWPCCATTGRCSSCTTSSGSAPWPPAPCARRATPTASRPHLHGHRPASRGDRHLGGEPADRLGRAPGGGRRPGRRIATTP